MDQTDREQGSKQGESREGARRKARRKAVSRRREQGGSKEESKEGTGREQRGNNPFILFLGTKPTFAFLFRGPRAFSLLGFERSDAFTIAEA
jgi:hypothetical protein